jgi:microcystin-dependent protein
MAEPFLSEIRIMSFGFPPQGWALCNGQLLPINQNQALFSLLGTTYGGNGQTTFALPNLQGRVPIHTGGGFLLGQIGGEQTHTLSIAEMPTHQHAESITTAQATTNTPSASVMLGQSVGTPIYGNGGSNLTPFAPNALTNVGGSQPHLNMQPYLTLNFSIALQGIFPSRN